MKHHYSFQQSEHAGYGETTLHKDCGGLILEARLLADDTDMSFDSENCWLICTANLGLAGIPEDFEMPRDASKLCLCIQEAVVNRCSFWDASGEHVGISQDLFVSMFIPEGALIPAQDPILKLETDKKTGATLTRVATPDEARAYHQKTTAALVQKWSEKAAMRDAE
jgi:hypothetical protein